MSLINPEWKIELIAEYDNSAIDPNNYDYRFVKWRILPSEIPWYLKPFIRNKWIYLEKVSDAIDDTPKFSLLCCKVYKKCLIKYGFCISFYSINPSEDNKKNKQEFKDIKRHLRTYSDIIIYNKKLQERIEKNIEISKKFYAPWR